MRSSLLVAWLATSSMLLGVACGGGSTADGGTGDSSMGSADTGPMGIDAGTDAGAEVTDASADGGGVLDARVPGCDDGEQNGLETDVDCGGGECAPCPEGGMCTTGTDCESGSCVGGVCAAPSCGDRVRNGDETDVDCGGVVCEGCAEGEGCRAGGDCASGVCDPSASTCAPSTCSDGVRNGDETDLDCGGSCPGCVDGLLCALDPDCASGFCDPTGATCATPTCTDGFRNGDEVDVDCGGAACPGCGTGGACTDAGDCASGVCDPGSMTCAAPSCADGVSNGDETGVDCGGGTCPACGPGDGCASSADCASGVCDPATSTCATPSCADAVRNGDETSVDCGGGTCPGCGDGLPCAGGSDCASGVCDASTSTCAAPSCRDVVRNGAETDVDCGGGTCPRCADGEDCLRNRDCTSRVCEGSSLLCVAPSCTDARQNGDETGVDCGGSCPGCPDGDPCARDEDCASLVCDGTTLTCAAPTCTDGARNGDETDTDCGGGTCPVCRTGDDCLLGRDCDSGVCGAGSHTCSAPSCTDGVRNDIETDVDCGGLGCPRCELGERCRRHTDCTTELCSGGRCAEFPSCAAILAAGASTGSGVYPIRPTAGAPFDVYCDMTTDGGGWTRIARLATGGGREITSINRTGSFFSRAWTQNTTSFTATTNDGVNLSTGYGMLDARALVGDASELRFSCSDSTRSLTGDAIWAASAGDRADFLASSLGSAGYALTSEPVRIDRNGAGYVSVSAYPTSDENGYWGSWHICGFGDQMGGPNTESTNGFQLGLCHTSPTSSDWGISDSNQIAIGYHDGFLGLRLECTADTPADSSQISGTWTAWVR